MSGRPREAQRALSQPADADGTSVAAQMPVGNSKVIDDIDFNIAMRLRALRVKAGMSQTKLGQAAGVSFQQMQKYEHARDRIASSTLQRLADALNVQAGWFFERGKIPRGEAISLNESLRVACHVQSISSVDVRRRLGSFIEALAESSTANPNLVQKRLMALADCIAEMHLPERSASDAVVPSQDDV